VAIRIFTGTTSPSLFDTIRVNGTAFDLTGSTVVFRMRAEGSSTLKVDASATVVAAASGEVRYDWVSADVDTAGDYLGWWRVTLPTTKVQESAEFQVEVVSHAPTSAPALCTIADVREWLQKPAGDISQDQLIEAVILRASRAILTYLDREVVLTTGANPQTRVFPIGGAAWTRLIRVGDMTSAPTAASVIGEDGATVTTLTAATDLESQPLVRASWEPITMLRLRRSAGGLAPDYRLSVTGSWGWPAVPEDVTQAAIMTAGHWCRRYVQAFSSSYSPEAGEDGVPESIPPAARAILAMHRRVVVP